MARTWLANLAAVTASYPSSVFAALDSKNEGTYTSAHTDNTLDGGAAGSFTVPASTPYKRYLDYKPMRTEITVTLNGVTASLVEWNPNAAGNGVSNAGQVAVNYVTGEVAFHSSDAGKLVVATYKNFGTVFDQTHHHKLQKEIAATQTRIDTIAPGAVVDEAHGGTDQTTYATGDMLYATGANQLGKRAIGSTGDVLTVAGGVPTWAPPVTPSGADVYTLATAGGDYSDASTAIAAINAMGGSQAIVLLVEPGTYTDTLTITRDNVHIIGRSRKACILTSTATAGFGAGESTVLVLADNCSLQNITVKNTGSGSSGDAFFALLVGQGVGGTGADNFLARNCDFWNNGAASNYRDTAYLCETSSNCVLEDCYIEGGTDVVCACGDFNTIRNCHIRGNGTYSAIWTSKKASGPDPGTTTYIYNCVFDTVLFGVALGSSEAVVMDCVGRLNGDPGDPEEPIALFQTDVANVASSIYFGGNVGLMAGTVTDGSVTQSRAVIDGDGSLLTALNATQLTSGTIPDARFPATLPAISGANLTNLDATDLTGTIADARLPAEVPLTDEANTFTADQTFSGAVDIGNATGSTDGHLYTKTGSGGTINELDISTDANFAKFIQTNASASLNYFQFQTTSTKDLWVYLNGNNSNAGLRLEAVGTDKAVNFFMMPTGTGQGSFRFYFPNGSTGSSTNTEYTDIAATSTNFDINVFGTTSRGFRVYNSDGTAVANASIEGRLGVGTTTPPTSGASLQTPSVAINGGTTIAGHLSNSASLTFDFSGGQTQTNTITVTGAAAGDVVALGPPADSDIDAPILFSAYVSAANTVKIVGYDPVGTSVTVSGTFRADVWKH